MVSSFNLQIWFSFNIFVISLDYLLTTSYYPRSSTDTRDSYNLTLSFVVFRVVQGSSVQVVVFNSSYYRRFLIKMQGGYHDTFYLIVQ